MTLFALAGRHGHVGPKLLGDGQDDPVGSSFHTARRLWLTRILEYRLDHWLQPGRRAGNMQPGRRNPHLASARCWLLLVLALERWLARLGPG